MIKIRVMGTREDLERFRDTFNQEMTTYLLDDPSDLLPLKGHAEYLRMYGKIYDRKREEEVGFE